MSDTIRCPACCFPAHRTNIEKQVADYTERVRAEGEAKGLREGIEAAAELAQAWGCCDGYSGGCMHKPIGAGEFARKYGEHRCVREAIRALLDEEAKP